MARLLRRSTEFFLLAFILAGTDPALRAQTDSNGTRTPSTMCRQIAEPSHIVPKRLRQPPPRERADVFVQANQPLRLDFSPFDAQGFWHRGNLTLIFDNDGVLVFHHVLVAGRPLSVAFYLPDGSIITPCDLLIAFPAQQNNSGAEVSDEKIPEGKIPEARSR